MQKNIFETVNRNTSVALQEAVEKPGHQSQEK
jgi:hypothetical protein